MYLYLCFFCLCACPCACLFLSCSSVLWVRATLFHYILLSNFLNCSQMQFNLAQFCLFLLPCFFSVVVIIVVAAILLHSLQFFYNLLAFLKERETDLICIKMPMWFALFLYLMEKSKILMNLNDTAQFFAQNKRNCFHFFFSLPRPLNPPFNDDDDDVYASILFMHSVECTVHIIHLAQSLPLDVVAVFVYITSNKHLFRLRKKHWHKFHGKLKLS